MPIPMIRIEITQAKTGRSMKKRAIGISRPAVYWAGASAADAGAAAA